MERDLKKIVSQMTLEEKAGMCSGLDFWHLKSVERLGIPEVMVSDGPHGLRKQDDKGDHLGMNDSIKAVCFPPAALSACSFDRKLMESMGETIGKEAQANAEETLNIIQRIHILQAKSQPHLSMAYSLSMLELPSSISQLTIRNITV